MGIMTLESNNCEASRDPELVDIPCARFWLNE